jgi:MFS family permease
MAERSISRDDKWGIAEVFASWDFAVGVAAAVGGIYVADSHPDRLGTLTSVLAVLVTVVIGTAIAGVAVQAALMSDAFLRRLRQIHREPTYYLRHWVLTVTLGVVGAFATGVLAGIPVTAPAWVPRAASGAACGFTAWTLGSLISAVVSLNGFVLLRGDAAQVDDVPSIGDGEASRKAG